MSKLIRFGVVLALLSLVSCAHVTEADREVNHQTLGAARYIGSQVALAMAGNTASLLDLARIGAAAHDIEQNSLVLQKNALDGPPKIEKAYSPDEAKAARAASDASHETPWWKVALGGAGTFLLGLLTSGKLTRFLPFLAGPFGSALNLVVEGIARVRSQAEESDGTIKLEGEGGLLETLAKVAETDPRAHELIKLLAHKAEAKLGGQL